MAYLCKLGCSRPRGVKSAGAFFVLLWNLLLFSYHQSALGNLVNLVVQDRRRKEGSGFDPWVLTIITAVLTDLLPKLLYPFAGWLADAKLGRYKVMRYSLWVLWMGSMLLILACMVRYILSDNLVEYMLPVFVVVYLINIVGIAGYHVNVIPFGIDQMEGASGDQITSFLQWYYWTRNVNFGVIIQLGLEFMPGFCDDNDTEEPKQRFELIMIVIQMFFLSAALCLDFLFSSKLHKDVKIHNPVKKVKDISVFILKHNRPVGRRRAYTFTYSAPPTRSDFAKQSYGGPFEDDEVEQVVSFWRIMLFLLAVGIGDFLFQTGFFNYTGFFDHMQSNISFLPRCSSRAIFVNSIYLLSFTFSIPIFEFLIYPFVRNYIPRSKVRIFLGMCVALLGLSALLSIDVTGHLHMSTAGSKIDTCMFYRDGQRDVANKLPINSLVLIPVMFVMSVGEMLIGISIFEFICAQAPYGMRGLIIGIFYMIYGVNSGLLLSLVLAAFSLGYLHHTPDVNMSCGTLYLLGVVLLGAVGVAVYVVAARCYKDRQRGGQRDENEQTTLEGYYESQIVVENFRPRRHTALERYSDKT